MIVSQNLASVPTSSFFFCNPSINNGFGFCLRIHHPEQSLQGKLCPFNTMFTTMMMMKKKRRSRLGLKMKNPETRRAVRMNGTAHEDNASSPVSTAEAAVELGLSLFRKGRVCMYLCIPSMYPTLLFILCFTSLYEHNGFACAFLYVTSMVWSPKMKHA